MLHHNVPEAKLFRRYIRLFSKTASFEAPPVDHLTFLRYLPDRLAPWKRLWKETRRLQRDLYFGLLQQTERRVSDGVRCGCFMEDILGRQVELGLSREMIGYVCILHIDTILLISLYTHLFASKRSYLGGSLIDGGSETTASSLQSLIYV